MPTSDGDMIHYLLFNAIILLILFCLRSTGFSFDLSPLSKPGGGFYNMSNAHYDYFINVCGSVTAAKCPVKAGACQVDQRHVLSY